MNNNDNSTLSLTFIPPYYEEGMPMGGHYEVRAVLSGELGKIGAFFRAEYIDKENAPWIYHMENITETFGRDGQVMDDLAIWSKAPLLSGPQEPINIFGSSHYGYSIKFSVNNQEQFWSVNHTTNAYHDRVVYSKLNSRDLFDNLVQLYESVYNSKYDRPNHKTFEVFFG
ncbi:hypothetical protein [Pontibacillus marinus]|uniref:Uncharacterized protein n=1 Tax=Pontibacillus marinus BH030004 = DSM 16465 TaxID=1385511 RepID=A0A0A5GIL2_9BACI|nr:hypothetical protein [Pontibacillus marinus]KGX91043.1 hypothetical protein N783_13580 [Pontibacillus marinus BH030004 = DSM 16465]